MAWFIDSDMGCEEMKREERRNGLSWTGAGKRGC